MVALWEYKSEKQLDQHYKYISVKMQSYSSVLKITLVHSCPMLLGTAQIYQKDDLLP